jgi:quinol monooxygenase YgiN
MIAILGQLDVHSDDFEDVKGLAATMMAETAKEAGCLKYAFAEDLLEPNRLQLSELWKDESSLAAHFQSAHMAVYRAGLKPLRIQGRTVKKYEVAGGVDL